MYTKLPESQHVYVHSVHCVQPCELSGLNLQMIFASRPGGRPQHFGRMYDKKVNLLGLLSLMTLPQEATPPQLQSAWPQLMAGTMRLLTTLKDQQVCSPATLAPTFPLTPPPPTPLASPLRLPPALAFACLWCIAELCVRNNGLGFSNLGMHVCLAHASSARQKTCVSLLCHIRRS